jgi:peroxin-19
MDNMMQQLLSREMMYDPLKQICDKYPEWLATHREALPEPDYLRYGAQYQSMQRVLAVYETEPDNFPRIMELMQDMQEHGQVSCDCLLVLVLCTSSMISTDRSNDSSGFSCSIVLEHFCCIECVCCVCYA